MTLPSFTADAPFNLNISVDCAVFGFNFQELQVLLVPREEVPGSQRFACLPPLKLPGNLIRHNEDLPAAAARVLFEVTGLENIFLKQFGAFGSPDRISPSEREWLTLYNLHVSHVVTVAYYSLVDIAGVRQPAATKPEAKWYNLSNIRELAMDHFMILQHGLEALRNQLRADPRVAFALLPEKFSIRQLQDVYQVILGRTLDNRNFRKKLASAEYLLPLNEKQTRVAHKPARLYSFDEKVFMNQNKQDFRLSF